MAYFALLWRAIDFEAGLVGHCPTCYSASREARAFGQPTFNKCPDCYGTTFEHGLRALIIRPALVSNRSTDTRDEARGEYVHESLSLETTEDFTARRGDFLIRADGIRYRLAEKDTDVLRTGFDVPDDTDAISGGITTAVREDPHSVAYLIATPAPGYRTVLTSFLGQHLPATNLADFEQIHGPLVV